MIKDYIVVVVITDFPTLAMESYGIQPYKQFILMLYTSNMVSRYMFVQYFSCIKYSIAVSKPNFLFLDYLFSFREVPLITGGGGATKFVGGGHKIYGWSK